MDAMNGYSEELDSVFRILLASDIHLGAHEADGVRGDDSFVTFEEILKLAQDREVDFILLGGDLFDHNIPSTKCYHKAISLLRKYTMGDKPINVFFESNQEEIFKHCDHKIVNYLDPNLNISIPVYSIHGNHDDPCGLGGKSALDLLSTCGLVNYFGKCTDLNNISLKPIILSKGTSKIALYGLGNIRDERLHRLFASRSVHFEATKDHANRFNILVLHQNRVERGPKNYIPEDIIPDFFNFVFWGHEHDCRIDPEENIQKGFVVVQPGSPVATSLCEGEAVPKHVAILKVQGTRYELEKIKLRTVRPFVFETARIADWNLTLPTQKRTEAIQQYVEKYIKKKMLPKAKEQLTGHPNQPTMPLIRLRLEFTEDYQQFNTIRFSQGFCDLIANASTSKNSEVVKLFKDTSIRNKRKQDYVPNMEGVEEDIANEISVEEIAERLLEEAEDSKNRLAILLSRALTIGVKCFVEKDDKTALDDIVHAQMKKIKAKLKEECVSEDNIKESIKAFRVDHEAMKQAIEDEARELLGSDERGERESVSAVGKQQENGGGSDSDSDFGPTVAPVATPKRGRGSRGGRVSTRAAGNGTGRGRGRGRAAKNNTTLNNTTMNITRFGTVRPRLDDTTSSFGSPSKKQKVAFIEDSDED